MKSPAGSARPGRGTIALATLLVVGCLAFAPVAAETSQPEVRLCYFYINFCASCRDADERIEYYRTRLETGTGRRVLIHAYNIAEPDNMALMQYFCAKYAVPEQDRSTPLLFVGDTFYQGEAAIGSGLEAVARQLEQGQILILLADPFAAGDPGRLIIQERFQAMRALQVGLAGLVNGLNPCSLSMLLFFLSLLLARQGTRILALGSAFLAAKFLTYLLLGTLFYNLFGHIDGAAYTWVIKGVLLLFVGVLACLNLRDFYYARREQYGQIKNQLPGRLRRFNHHLLARLQQIEGHGPLLAASVGLGILITAGEFLCTGQIYLATILYMVQSDSVRSSQAVIYLVLYAAAFILPAFVVLLLLAGTRRLAAVSSAIQRHLPVIKLITAICLLLIGGVIIFTL